MYELRIVAHFAAAHQLRGFHGKCEDLHGHNWKVEVHVRGSRLGEDGLLVDFRDVKKATENVLDGLDHKFLNELDPFREINPSSENIAHYIYDRLTRELNHEEVKMSRVTVWESETASATYTES